MLPGFSLVRPHIALGPIFRASADFCMINPGLWKLIHGIMDPVVASKVHFLSGAKGLEQMIPPNHILKELGGDEDWEYQYIEPQPHEDDKLQDVDTRNNILADRKKLGDDLFSVTAERIEEPQAEVLKSRRDEVIKKLRDNYWTLDPYVRARNILDRTGVIKERGEIDFYPGEEAKEETRSGTASIKASKEAKEKAEHVENEPLGVVAA